MQETFGPQFIDRFMKPLLQRIVTDMSEPKAETQYLQRIMIGGETAKLKDLEKEHFFNEYFRKDKTKPFSGTEEEDKKFQNRFLDEFTDFFQMRRKLSGIEGVRKALLPDKDKNFSGEVSRNIFQMAYRMCLDFEKERIQEILKKEKGEMSVKDQEDLDAGRLKLIIVNGVERVIHEDEAKNAAEDFGDAKAASMETLLEKNGLEMVGGLSFDPADKEKRFLKGKVRDVNGQLLNVRIDTKATKDDSHKFAFTFAGPPPAGTKGKDRTGETFFLSQKDLKKFEPEPGKRQSAEDIAHPKVGKLAEEKKAPIPTVGLPTPGVPGGVIPQVGSMKITGGELPFKPFKLEAKGKEKIQIQLPGGIASANMPAGYTGGGGVGETTETVITGGAPGSTIKPMLPGVKPLPAGSVAVKKQEVAAKKAAPGAMPPPPGGSFATGGGYASQTAAPQPKKGGSWKTTAAIAGGHAVGIGAALGGAVASHNAAASNPENLAGATSFVIHIATHCIGLICHT